MYCSVGDFSSFNSLSQTSFQVIMQRLEVANQSPQFINLFFFLIDLFHQKSQYFLSFFLMKISSNIVPISHQELIISRSPSDGIHTLSTSLTPSCNPQLHVQPGPLNFQACYPCLDMSILFFQKAALYTRMYYTIQGIYPVFYSNWILP